MQGYVARIFTSFIDVPEEIAIAIYFSGCSIRCIGCHNKALWERESGKLISDQEILKKINNNELANYVVFLGGEPTDQLDFLIHLCILIKKYFNKLIALYTGREFESLPDELLGCLDLVVCGPYIDELHTSGWPASSNQRVFKKKGKTWMD